MSRQYFIASPKSSPSSHVVIPALLQRVRPGAWPIRLVRWSVRRGRDVSYNLVQVRAPWLVRAVQRHSPSTQTTISSTIRQSLCSGQLREVTYSPHSQATQPLLLTAISSSRFKDLGCKPLCCTSSCDLLNNSLSFPKRTNVTHDIYT